MASLEEIFANVIAFSAQASQADVEFLRIAQNG